MYECQRIFPLRNEVVFQNESSVPHETISGLIRRAIDERIGPGPKSYNAAYNKTIRTGAEILQELESALENRASAAPICISYNAVVKWNSAINVLFD